MTKNKPTLARLFFSIAYLFVCCLAFFFLALIVVKFIISHDVVFDRSDIKQIVVVSAIAATAAGVRSWLYALLDERKIRKKPPE
jgi:cytochrome bd-type quinol oxidase subunit 1